MGAKRVVGGGSVDRNLGDSRRLFEDDKFKPIGLLNVRGFYDGLVRFIEHLVTQQFLRPEHASLLLYEADAVALLKRFESFEPQYQDKLLHRTAAETLLP